MKEETRPSSEVEGLAARLNEDAERAGYHVNPDRDFTLGLVQGLLENERRYGYRSCPCRLAAGERAKDLDIVCPCDYRDADLVEWGCCYCALYVSDEVLAGEKDAAAIPERRPPEGERRAGAADLDAKQRHSRLAALPLPVWRCRVCGYLCAREKPPLVCPICKAKQDRFERFM